MSRLERLRLELTADRRRARNDRGVPARKPAPAGIAMETFTTGSRYGVTIVTEPPPAALQLPDETSDYVPGNWRPVSWWERRS